MANEALSGDGVKSRVKVLGGGRKDECDHVAKKTGNVDPKMRPEIWTPFWGPRKEKEKEFGPFWGPRKEKTIRRTPKRGLDFAPHFRVHIACYFSQRDPEKKSHIEQNARKQARCLDNNMSWHSTHCAEVAFSTSIKQDVFCSNLQGNGLHSGDRNLLCGLDCWFDCQSNWLVSGFAVNKKFARCGGIEAMHLFGNISNDSNFRTQSMSMPNSKQHQW